MTLGNASVNQTKRITIELDGLLIREIEEIIKQAKSVGRRTTQSDVIREALVCYFFPEGEGLPRRGLSLQERRPKAPVAEPIRR